jgi:hypothetical protein
MVDVKFGDDFDYCLVSQRGNSVTFKPFFSLSVVMECLKENADLPCPNSMYEVPVTPKRMYAELGNRKYLGSSAFELSHSEYAKVLPAILDDFSVVGGRGLTVIARKDSAPLLFSFGSGSVVYATNTFLFAVGHYYGSGMKIDNVRNSIEIVRAVRFFGDCALEFSEKAALLSLVNLHPTEKGKILISSGMIEVLADLLTPVPWDGWFRPNHRLEQLVSFNSRDYLAWAVTLKGASEEYKLHQGWSDPTT